MTVPADGMTDLQVALALIVRLEKYDHTPDVEGAIAAVAEVAKRMVPTAERGDQTVEAAGAAGRARTDQTAKVEENRLRRIAERQGLSVSKSRRRDSLATDFGVYRLLRGEKVVVESRSLVDIERTLVGGARAEYGGAES